MNIGKNKDEDILIPNIKDEKDIPEKVKTFFKDSYEFLEDLVGKENIVYAEVHYDEDTPHMHFYFIPVVNEIKRKVFETDSKGNLVKHEVIGKDVDNLIDYSKQIKKQHILNTKDIKEKDYTIETMSKKIGKLNLEITKLKDGRGIKERDKLIEKNKLLKKKCIVFVINSVEL